MVQVFEQACFGAADLKFQQVIVQADHQFVHESGSFSALKKPIVTPRRWAFALLCVASKPVPSLRAGNRVLRSLRYSYRIVRGRLNDVGAKIRGFNGGYRVISLLESAYT